MVKDMPVAAVARLLGEHDTRLWRIIHHYVEEARAAADFSPFVTWAWMRRRAKRGQNYITLFVALDEPKLLFATEGRHWHGPGVRSRPASPRGRTEQIEDFCLDMSAAYRKGIEEWFPEAEITFDKFHIMKLMNEAVDQVRRQEQKERPELKGSRYVWIKNPLNLTVKQIGMSDALHLPPLNLKTVRAYHIRLTLQDLWQQSIAEASCS